MFFLSLLKKDMEVGRGGYCPYVGAGLTPSQDYVQKKQKTFLWCSVSPLTKLLSYAKFLGSAELACAQTVLAPNKNLTTPQQFVAAELLKKETNI
jgi:hypothetical protein